MPVNFATFIAHQASADYTAFNNALTPGRPFRQPLQTAPNPNDYAAGLELFLSSAGDVAIVYACLSGILRWQVATAANPGHRLILLLDPTIVTGNNTLASLPMIEALPYRIIYENVDQNTVQASLELL